MSLEEQMKKKNSYLARLSDELHMSINGIKKEKYNQ